MNSSYDVKNDEYFKDYAKVNGITEGTANKYAFELNKLCKANNMEFSDFVNECKYEQSYVKVIPVNKDDDGTNEYFKIKFDVNNPNNLIKKGLNAYVDYCKERGNHNTNINNSMACIRGILNHCDIELPKWKPLEDDAEDWELLEKEDFLFVLNDCSINHKSLITFMLSSGIRLGDCLSLTIGDFMKATSDFHNFVEVDDFIDNAPQDMMGYWAFTPKKTIKRKIECKTMNSQESSNYILQNLRRVKNEYLPKKSKKIGEKLKMSKNDALFGSRHKLYKGEITVAGISEQFRLKNKKLRDWHINKIKKDIEKGNLSEEDFDYKVSKIPKFHAHACRKYFQSTVSDYCGNLRICAMMEGHKPPLKNDKSYIKINKNTIRETYNGKLLEALTLENIEVKTVSSEEIEELNNEIADLKDKLAKFTQTKDVGISYEKELWDIIFRYYRSKNEIYGEHKKEALVLCQYALEFAINDVINFKEDDAHIENLFIKARAVNEMYPQNFEETYIKASAHLKNGAQDSEYAEMTRLIIAESAKYDFVKIIIDKKEDLARSSIFNYLKENNIKTDDLNTEKIKEILTDLLINKKID